MDPESFETAERDLERAQEGSDEARLEVLEELYRQLEAALDHDVGQSGPARH